MAKEREKRKKIKTVKGKIIYEYKGRYVLECPSGCYVKYMYYSERHNSTVMVLKRIKHKTEILCLLLVIAMAVIKLYNAQFTCAVSYDSSPLYNNRLLYINVQNKSNSSYPVDVQIEDSITGDLVARKHLEIGDEWLTLPLAECNPEYIIRVSSVNVVGREAETARPLKVIHREDISAEGDF